MAIVVNKQTRVPYEYLGEDRYRNLHTGIEGYVEPEKANKIFNIHLEATYYFGRFPEIKDLVKILKLRLNTGDIKNKQINNHST